VAQGNVHKAPFNEAWTGGQREPIAELHQSVISGVLRAVEIALDEFALFRWTIPIARERINVFDGKRMSAGDFGRVALPDQDADVLRDLLVRERPRVVIEIGLAYGSSALAIGEALLSVGHPEANHVMIDAYQGRF
jgi:hypothetical protein